MFSLGKKNAKNAGMMTSGSDEIIELILENENSLVLVDIGSAGVSPDIWRSLAPAATIVGFEPDARNPDKTFGQDYKNAILINKAIIPDVEADKVSFVLTDYPSCSSMLEPDLDALSSFVFRDYFKPVRRVEVSATSLSRMFRDNDLAGANWIKLDSQGADLRILNSIEAEHLEQLLAVDIEPGFIDAYKDEDLFTDCHAWLKDQGFWLSELKYQAYAKMRPETMAALEEEGYDKKELLAKLPKCPTAAEARYLREIAWLEKNAGADAELWIKAFAIGLVDRQIGYLFDMVLAYEHLIGRDKVCEKMRKLATNALEEVL